MPHPNDTPAGSLDDPLPGIIGNGRAMRAVYPRATAATNPAVEQEILAGRFREDLYYRLNVVPIRLPPLRERRDDIPALARYFFERYSEQNRREAPEVSDAVLKALGSHEWRG